MFKNQLYSYYFSLFSCSAFILLCVIAMNFYPGSTYIDHNTQGYYFFKNYFSDLGRTITHSGELNTISSYIFITALTFVGLGFSSFYLETVKLFNDKNSKTYYMSRLGTLLAIISGIGFVGVGWAPSDTLHQWHMLFVKIAFRSLALVMLIYGFCFYSNKGDFPNWLSHVYIFSGILLVTYVCIMIWGPDGRTVEGLPIQVASQKIIVFSIGISVIVQALGLINYIKKT